MKPYTATELDALEALAELHSRERLGDRVTSSPLIFAISGNVTLALAKESLRLIKMIRSRDEVIAKLQAKLDEYESRIREAVREYSATVGSK